MANRLSDEKSPYLRQHADNPVDWYPFSEEAFEIAKARDIPIFLSIGYSTCHWCHVMNRESFSDQKVAEALRGRFIAVKVDREERPEVDRIAMVACQLMTGSGGWPLTLVLTPEKRPFFSGTYIPKLPKYGRAGLIQVLDRIWDLWEKNRDEAEGLSLRVEGAVQSYLRGETTVPEKPGSLKGASDEAYIALAGSFDRENGGFGTAPKFPTPHIISFLLRYAGMTGRVDATRMAIETLHALRMGGINDQIGGGYHRYATDQEWAIPHYEKMATDQALLLTAFAEGYRVTRDPLLKEEAERIARYIRSDLRSEEGLFFTAEDAESGGEEGGFYLWSKEEIRSALDAEDGAWAADLFLGNAGEKVRMPLSLTEPNPDPERLMKVREKLREKREARTRPFRDEKILLDINGMMIASLARAGHLIGDAGMITDAEDAYNHLSVILEESGDELFHSRINGVNTTPANLTDYAELIGAGIMLHQATGKPTPLRDALRLTEMVIFGFFNPEKGWFWFEREGSSFFRTRDLEDAGGPSGNAVMLHNLHQLSRITGNIEMARIAGIMEEKLSAAFLHHPTAHIHAISASSHHSGAAVDVVITGDATPFMAPLTQTRNILTTWLPVTPDLVSGLQEKAPKLEVYEPGTSESVAYPCSEGACLPPVTDPDELREILDTAFHHRKDVEADPFTRSNNSE
ncbi:uncharacterized protein YyaL (SSP411 family) [Methanocalculus alkaliphilus]|uniref:thioredoxin domain-containing protein n=1 Tax=Methanocalculus alkaliphilus TaxID=768730 RepID=UPI0020A1C8E4|nr:thioredoxin domain-containing protein [Methanocalculus alkaliphilus]MCP1715196.1 uncharacterized protein YyaL (SSP411 family) [Methanocalculus alkaliphilus]